MLINDRVLVVCLFLFTLSRKILTNADLPTPHRKYKILMLAPYASESHRNCFIPLANALADRGHKVTLLSPLSSKINRTEVREINHGIRLLDKPLNVFKIKNLWLTLINVTINLSKNLYTIPVVKELYNKRDEFDIAIIDDMFEEVVYPFLEGKRFITLATPGFRIEVNEVLGNLLNPAYVPFYEEFPHPYTFFQRIKVVYSYIQYIIWRRSIAQIIEKEIKSVLPQVRSFSDIKKGLILNLANTHFSINFPIPTLPSQIEVGCMHCRPANKIADVELERFVNESSQHGVIYFSLGSISQGNILPEEYRNILIEAFKNLKQRVLWKFEGDIPNLPSNIMIEPWFPQQDILGHKNVKLFITHGGLLSVQESIYHKKPMLAFPLAFDQHKNGQILVNKGIGKTILWKELSVDLLLSTIHELLSNESYLDRVREVSRLFRDQPISPVENAVWWTEYAIRNNNSDVLDSPAKELSIIEIMSLDILFLFQFILFLFLWIMKKASFFIVFRCCKKNQKSSNRKKKVH